MPDPRNPTEPVPIKHAIVLVDCTVCPFMDTLIVHDDPWLLPTINKVMDQASAHTRNERHRVRVEVQFVPE